MSIDCPADFSDTIFLLPADNNAENEGGDANATASSGEQLTIPEMMPVLPVRDIVIFNYMLLPLQVSREKSLVAVEAALADNRFLFVVTQKNERENDPDESGLYKVGTITLIMRTLKMPDGTLKVLVQGIGRGKIKKIDTTGKFYLAEVEHLPEAEAEPTPSVEYEAMLRTAREQSERILSLRGFTATDVVQVLNGIDDPGRMADLIAANLRMKTADAQRILECRNPIERLELVNTHLAKEVEVATIQAKIQSTAREGMEKSHKDYFLREQIKAIRHELGEDEKEDEENDRLSKALTKARLPKEVRKEADRQLKRLLGMHQDSAEASVVRTYLEWLAELPWRKLSKDQIDIGRAEKILNEDHYGLEKVKERILEFLSVRKLNPDSKGPILCLVGPPGVGKTSLGRSVARAMGRQFQRMSLGGVRDEAEIRGHRRTYVGAMPGRILHLLRQAKTKNPVIMLDEIDKIGADFRGDPSSALLEVLDPEQNFNFQDHYLGVPFDLSKVMFICTANQMDTIPGPLRDRMEIIRIPGYTVQEKTSIAKRYLLPRQLKDNGLQEKDVALTPAVLTKLIQEYTREAGLRNLEREIGALCRKVARKKAEGEAGPFKITSAALEKLLGAPRFTDEEKEKRRIPGLALGLAWTPYGGEVLHIEATTLPGNGAFLLTGQLGDVMKESAQAAKSYARSRARQLKIDEGFNATRDIHLHVPAGATPKDGPSAGITIAVALLSALMGKPVTPDLCMTGELTLRGRVLPVGGIKEKILAAVSRKLKHVIIPKQNIKDLEDIPSELLEKITVHPVSHMDEVLPLAFEK